MHTPLRDGDDILLTGGFGQQLAKVHQCRSCFIIRGILYQNWFADILELEAATYALYAIGRTAAASVADKEYAGFVSNASLRRIDSMSGQRSPLGPQPYS